MTAETLFDYAERNAILARHETEEWRDIPGFTGYMVSSLGRVRSLPRSVPRSDGHSQPIAGRIRSCTLDSKGYPRLTIRQNGVVKLCAVHRLVMLAFHPRDDWERMHVNHKDGVRTNNRLENLEWCTNSENRLHSYRVLKRTNPMAGRCRGLHPNHTQVTGRSLETGEIREYPSMSAVTDDGFRPGDVSSCARGVQRTHKNWEWKHGTSSVWRITGN